MNGSNGSGYHLTATNLAYLQQLASSTDVSFGEWLGKATILAMIASATTADAEAAELVAELASDRAARVASINESHTSRIIDLVTDQGGAVDAAVTVWREAREG